MEISFGCRWRVSASRPFEFGSGLCHVTQHPWWHAPIAGSSCEPLLLLTCSPAALKHEPEAGNCTPLILKSVPKNPTETLKIKFNTLNLLPNWPKKVSKSTGPQIPALNQTDHATTMEAPPNKQTHTHNPKTQVRNALKRSTWEPQIMSDAGGGMEAFRNIVVIVSTINEVRISLMTK